MATSAVALILVLAGCGGTRTTYAEQLEKAADSYSGCTYWDGEDSYPCEVRLSQKGKALTFTLADGSRLTIGAVYRFPNGDYVDDCFDDLPIADGDWIYEGDRRGDIELYLPLTSCSTR